MSAEHSVALGLARRLAKGPPGTTLAVQRLAAALVAIQHEMERP